jgi:hypothetical protein
MFEAFDEGGDPGAGHRQRGGLRRSAQPPSGEPVRGGCVMASAIARVAFEDVLQHVHLREVVLDAHKPPDPQRLNERLLVVLNACHEVDNARQRLLDLLSCQQQLQDVSVLLAARAKIGLTSEEEPLDLERLLAEVRRSIDVATSMWDVAGRHFTRMTRLLPAQLEAHAHPFAPVAPSEIERLGRMVHWRGTGPTERFARTREAYLQTLMDWELEQVRWCRACDLRRASEGAFRVGEGPGSGLAFARAVIDQDWQRGQLLVRQAHACMQGHTLYAIAHLLPAQLGWG